MNWSRWIPLAAVLTAALHLSWLAKPQSAQSDKLNVDAFGRLPIQDGGRVKPLDTVARVTLTIINSRQTCTDLNGKVVSPIQWLLEAMALEAGDRKAPFAHYRIFRVDNTQLVDMLGVEKRPGSWRYSLAELAPKFDQLQREADRAGDVNKKDRTLFDEKVLDLHRHLGEFLRIHTWRLAVIPPAQPVTDGAKWQSPEELQPEILFKRAIASLQQNAAKNGTDLKKLPEQELFGMVRKEQEQLREQASPKVQQFAAIIDAYRAGDAEAFNRAVESFGDVIEAETPRKDISQARTELFFNRVSPFSLCMVYYVITFFVICIGWAFYSAKPQTADWIIRAGVALAAWTFALHTMALIGRMYLMNRPFVFVTNLYSSAVYISWFAALMGLAIEFIFHGGIGSAIASLAGFGGLWVAYFIDLGMEGDKLEMMQAVLDTNFWLATHVTCVASGYSATLVAGFVACVYIFLDRFTKLIDKDLRQIFASLIYGVICFATLLSFVGTVLGGIWADYSWGRFWGWDPKENGAMLIVLWNALILHARWAGVVKQHGLAVMAVFGNIVTAWSWFGTNQLGVGLHSYGFTSAAATALVTFDVVMLGIMVIGMMPRTMWTNSLTAAEPRSKRPSDPELAKTR